MRRRYIALLILLFLGLFLAQALLYRSFGLNPDESYFMFMGQSISEGAVPYVDYTDNKPPGIWYLTAAALEVFDTSIYVSRYLLYVTNALSALVLFFIGRRVVGRTLGILGAVFYLIGVLVPAFQAYHALTEPYVSFFSLLGLMFFLMGDRRKGLLVLSGLMVGIAALFKQTGVLLLAAIMIYYLVNLWVQENRKFSIKQSINNSLLLLGGFIIPVAAVVLYFWGLGALDKLFFYSVNSLFGYGHMFNFTALAYQAASFAAIWFLAFVALLVAAYRFSRRVSDWRTLVSIWFLLTLLPLLSRQFGHYYVQILPPACLLAAAAVIENISKIVGGLKKTAAMYRFGTGIAVALTAVAIGVSILGYLVNHKESRALLQEQLAAADYIRDHTTESEKILAYPYEPSVYFLADRAPGVKLLILKSSVGQAIENELLEQIIGNSPKYVLLVTGEDGEVETGLPKIYEYIAEQFHQEVTIGDFIISRNNSSANQVFSGE